MIQTYMKNHNLSTSEPSGSNPRLSSDICPKDLNFLPNPSYAALSSANT